MPPICTPGPMLHRRRRMRRRGISNLAAISTADDRLVTLTLTLTLTLALTSTLTLTLALALTQTLALTPNLTP